MDKLIKTLDKKQMALLLVLGSYMFQGAATLIYQVSWEQAMENIVGMALPTMSIIISIFFLGMALGAYIFGKLSIKQAWTGRLFALNQVCIALFAFIFVFTGGLKVLCFLTTGSEAWLPLVYILRLIILGAFLLIPAFLVGAAFPLLIRSNILISLPDKAEKLYLVNLMGSIIGAIGAGFILLPNFGLIRSNLFAGALSVLVVPIFLLAEKMSSFEQKQIASAGLESLAVSGAREEKEKEKAGEKEEKSEKTKEKEKTGTREKVLFLLVIMAAAFFNMLLELLFIRLLSLFMGASAIAFSLVSAMQLFAIGCASFVVNFVYKQKKDNFWTVFMFLYLFASAWLLIESIFFPDLSVFIVTEKQVLAGFGGDASFFFSYLIILFMLMFIPCFCLGANLPLYFQLRHLYPEFTSIKASYAYAINLFASVLGCLIGGVFIFPILSGVSNHAIYLAFVSSAMIILFIGLVIYIFGVKRNGINKFVVLATGILAIGILFFCYYPLAKRPLLKSGAEMLFYKEGTNATVVLAPYKRENLISLQTDGQTEATLPLNESLPASMSDQSTQVLLGILPGLFSLRKMKSVFLLGFGTGVTAQTILSNAEVESVSAAELEPAVIVAANYLKRYSPDARLKIKIIDGRNMLSMLDRYYDAIVSQPGEPWRTSSKYLYTLEFWQLAKSRLQTDGIFCQWLPLYGIDKNNLLVLCRTFASVFPNTFVIREKRAGELILLAFNSDVKEKNIEWAIMSTMIDKAAGRIKVIEIKNYLARLGFDNLSDLLSIFRLSPQYFHDWLRNGQVASIVKAPQFNCDNFPFVQYRTESLIMRQGISIQMNIDKIVPTVPMPKDLMLKYQYPI